MTDTDDKLMAAAGKLATDIAPQRDLWPGIAEAIGKPRRARMAPWLAQAAAIVLLVGASSLLTYSVMKYDTANTPAPVAVEAVPRNLVFEQTAFGDHQTLSSLYGMANGNVASGMGKDLETLSPEVREAVVQNLALIRQSIKDISKALEKEPNNAFLQELLVEAYGRELALMNRIGSLAQRSTARKDI